MIQQLFVQAIDLMALEILSPFAIAVVSILVFFFAC